MTQPPTADRTPLSWRLLDAVDGAVAALWPARAGRALPYALLLPSILLVLILVAGLAYIGDYSLRTLDRSTFRLSDDYSLENYRTILDRPVYLLIIWRTVLAAAVVTVTTLVLAFPYAYAMARTGSALVRKALLISLFLPFFIGQVVRAYGWLILLGHQGLFNTALGWFGIAPVKIIYTFPGVLIGLTQYMLPFAVLLLAPAITAIGREVEQASAGLGATWPRTLWHVVLPMAKPGLIAAGVVVFAISVTDLAIPEILGGGSNDFIANAIYDGFFAISDAGLGSALGVVLVALASLLVAAIFTAVGVGTLSYVERGRR